MSKTLKYKPLKLTKQTLRRIKEREEEERLRYEQEMERIKLLEAIQHKKDFIVTISRDEKYIIEF